MPKKPQWDLEGLTGLIENSAPEDRSLDYKSALVLSDDEKKRDFVKDVTSFANSIGGSLLYGVKEEALHATELPGIAVDNKDHLIRRLDDLLRTGSQPRVQGVTYEVISLENGRFVLAVNVPQSFEAPHMVVREPQEFWARGAASNYRMDVYQLRDAFLASETVTERAHAFRIGRLTSIEGGQAPVNLNETAQIVMHILSASAFARKQVVDLDTVYRGTTDIFPRVSESFRHGQAYCLEGLLQTTFDQEVAATYSLLHRNGCFEIVDANSCGTHNQSGTPLFYPRRYEDRFRQSLNNAIMVLQSLDIPEPYFIGLAVLHCRGFGLYRGSPVDAGYKRLDRDRILLLEGSIEIWDGDVDGVLKPQFDMILNAFGYPRSTNYNSDGIWAPKEP
jgi:hypothetical protein